MVGRIATGEVEDERDELISAAAQLGSKGGKSALVRDLRHPVHLICRLICTAIIYEQ